MKCIERARALFARRLLISATLASFTFVLVAATGLASAAQAATEEKASAFVLCKSKKDVRTIRVLAEPGGSGCTTMYTKAGQDKIVSGSRYLGSCKSVLKSIRANLEAASWNCRTVESAQVMLGDEIFHR
jgi:hypothetical protein